MIGGAWQGAGMTTPSSQAGGFLLVLCILIGTAFGIWQGQPSIGVLGGTAVGVLIAVALWWRDRARAGR